MSFEVIAGIDKSRLPFLDSLLLDGNKRVIPLNACFYHEQVTHQELRLWCHARARYCLPTGELIDWLAEHIHGKKAIEIGAGMGDLGYRLKIPMTDSYQQVNDPATIFAMDAGRQPRTQPPLDVMRMDAQTAVLKMKPQVVIGAWITQRWLPGDDEGNMHGPREEQIIKNCETYIFIGNEKIHGRKRILKVPHETYHFPWLVSRATEPAKNVIYVWHREKIL